MSEDPEQLLKQVGQRIAELRRGLGLTQKALAERLGISAPYMSQMEHGSENLTLRTMVKLAAALGVRTADLLEPPASPSAPSKG